jgi:hypothetical protein
MSDSDDDESEAIPVEDNHLSIEEGTGKHLNVIWDDDKIEKYIDNNGKQHWRCLWCKRSFQHWNATKALYHVNKKKGGAVRSCKSTNIDEVHKAAYIRLLNKMSQKKNSQAQLLQGKKRASEEYLDTAAELYVSSKRRKTPPSASSTSISTKNIIGPPSQIQTQLNFVQDEHKENQLLDTHRSYQPKVSDSIENQAEGRLTMAIADLIHSCGLPFSLASHHKFQRVLTYAKHAPKNYTPPTVILLLGRYWISTMRFTKTRPQRCC